MHAHAQHGPVPALPTLLCLPCWPHWPTPLRPFVVRAQVQPGMRDTIASFLAAARASFEVLLLAKVPTPTRTLTLHPTLTLDPTLTLTQPQPYPYLVDPAAIRALEQPFGQRRAWSGFGLGLRFGFGFGLK